MVTKEMLDGWRASRRKLTPAPSLTPNNSRYGYLGYQLDVMREQRIHQAEKAMKADSNKLNQDMRQAFNQGRVKAQFNHARKQNL